MSTINFPEFNTIDLSTYVQRLDVLLETNLAIIDSLINQSNVNWDNLIYPLEQLDNTLEYFWSPLSHLHSVMNSSPLRDCYETCLPKLSAYEAAVGQNNALYSAIKRIDITALNPSQQKIISDMLLNFELSGVALPSEKKQRFEAIHTRLSELSNKFENNVLDAGQAFKLHVTDAQRLQGLPEHALNTANELAIENGLTGWMLNLEFPCYIAVVSYADDRALREMFYHAYVTRASDQGPSAGQFDNTPIINELLALKHEQAQLLGFDNYATLSLATKMASSPQQVIDFLDNLIERAHAQAITEVHQLEHFAQAEGLEKLQPWDIAYLSEKMRKKYYDISQEELRFYFPQDKVLSGLFEIVKKLYGITIEVINNVDSWHADVNCYRLVDDQHEERGFIYMDLFARQQKNGGAWMDSLQSRQRLSDGSIQLPIATLTCNFAKPAANQIAYFSHEEVLTLFHEMGHCLHHLLTKVDYLSASGINGVEWDAVELPSQIFENWCWEKNALELLTRHMDTGKTLPANLYEKLLAAKNFQSAMTMMRQLEFSLFDFRLHHEFMPNKPNFVTDILNDVRRYTTVVPIAAYNRFPQSFTHVFSGGYDAGYYSYKWAELLSSDAYSRFEDEGIFNTQTGKDFLQCILEVGSSKKAADAFFLFRGREAQINALLRHNGIQ